MTSEYLLGIDIGGTEIKGGAVGISGDILYRTSRSTNAKNGIQAIIASLDAVIEDTLNYAGECKAICVASAGNIDCKTGKVLYATDNLPGYTGFNLTEHIAEKFNLPCRCENDAYAALLGEMKYGAARGSKDVAMVTIGTGIGGALALNGKIVHGKNYAAARWGHTVLVPGGAACNCGQSGCSEQYLSGNAFTLGAIKLGYAIIHGSQVFDLIIQGDSILKKYLDEYLDMLTNLLITIKNAADPEKIVIGGGFVNSADYWWEDLRSRCEKYNIVIIPARLKNNAGILGATSLFSETGGLFID